MVTVAVEGETRIARPLDVVQAQFVDMAHHEAAGVHANLRVGNVRPQPGGCRFTGQRHIFGMVQEDEIEVARGADGGSTLRSLGGSNAGLLITQRFTADGPAATRVHIRVELPLPGLRALLAPLVRLGLRRDVAAALAEDRADLEGPGYART